MTPALLAHAANSTAPLIPGVATPSEVMQALEAGYDHLKFFPAEANGGTKALAAIAAPLPQVKFCPTGGIGPKTWPTTWRSSALPPSAAPGCCRPRPSRTVTGKR